MVPLNIWKSEWMKILFKLTFNIKIVTSLLEHNLSHKKRVFRLSFRFLWLWNNWRFLSSIICEYYSLNIIVNPNSFSTLNIYLNNTLKYYDSQALNVKLKLMEGAMILFSKKLQAMKYLALRSTGLQNIFWKICKPSGSPPTYLMYTPLHVTCYCKISKPLWGTVKRSLSNSNWRTFFPNFVYLTIFHNKFLSGPAKRKKIKTWHKNCYIITADIKINSKNISDKNNRKVYDKEERDKL